MGGILAIRRNQSYRIFVKQVEHNKYRHCIHVTILLLKYRELIFHKNRTVFRSKSNIFSLLINIGNVAFISLLLLYVFC